MQSDLIAVVTVFDLGHAFQQDTQEERDSQEQEQERTDLIEESRYDSHGQRAILVRVLDTFFPFVPRIC